MTISEVFIAAIIPKGRTVDIDKKLQNQTTETALSRSSQALSLHSLEAGQGNRRVGGIHESVVALHDSLAEVLVTEEEHERIAIGSVVSSQGTTIYVASDENRNLPRMVEQLRRLWTKLQEIKRNKVETIDGNHTSDVERMIEFRTLIYEYSWNIQWTRYERFTEFKAHLDNLFNELLREGSSYVINQPPNPKDNDDEDDEDEYILTEEVPLVEILKMVCNLTEDYNENKSPAMLQALAEGIFILDRKFEQDKNDIISRLDAIDLKETGTRSFSVRNFWENLSALERIIPGLLRIPYSRRLSSTLDRDFNVIPVHTDAIPLRYNVFENPYIHEILEEASWTLEDFRDEWKYSPESLQSLNESVHPHCECALLAFLIKSLHHGDMDFVPHSYIGLSEPLCTGCQLYYFSYNSVAERHGLPKFYMRGSQRDNYSPWAKPRGVPQKLDEDIEKHLSAHAKELLVDILWEEERRRERHSDVISFLNSVGALREFLRRSDI